MFKYLLSVLITASSFSAVAQISPWIIEGSVAKVSVPHIEVPWVGTFWNENTIELQILSYDSCNEYDMDISSSKTTYTNSENETKTVHSVEYISTLKSSSLICNLETPSVVKTVSVSVKDGDYIFIPKNYINDFKFAFKDPRSQYTPNYSMMGAFYNAEQSTMEVAHSTNSAFKTYYADSGHELKVRVYKSDNPEVSNLKLRPGSLLIQEW